MKKDQFYPDIMSFHVHAANMTFLRRSVASELSLTDL